MTPQSATARALLAALALLSAALPAGAQQAGAEPRAPLGRWITESGNLEVEIAPCTPGSPTLCGKVVRVMANRSMAGPGQAGEFADKRPALGMTLLSGFRPSGANEHQGQIYNRETLEIKFKNKSIADVLDMTCEDARDFFQAVPSIREKMDALCEVGLGYIKVGQQATTLSGGEAQRVKLSKELSKRATGRTLYILDEPTTGLHFEDVRKLLEVLHSLVDQGNTVVVIEHNLDVIKTADWIIDIGPEGGDGGGKIVATGTPEAVAKVEASHTGRYLGPMLKPKRVAAE